MSQSPSKVALSPIFSNLSIPCGASIAVINIMDNAKSTEAHFKKTILSADPNAQITWCRMKCAEQGEKYFTEHQHLLSPNYDDWHDVIGKKNFDLVIFTGINRGNLSYYDLAKKFPAFWEETQQLVRKIKSSIHSGTIGHTALICWAAFAAMKELYGIEKGIHSEKFYGLFHHSIANPDHPLAQGFGEDAFLVPQSRYSFMEEDKLSKVIQQQRGEIVMHGPDGPAIWTLEQNRMTCFINHLEYGIDTLHREWKNGQKYLPNCPPPQNYSFDPEGSNLELEVVFEQLGLSCGHFYKNLIHFAKGQQNNSRTFGCTSGFLPLNRQAG